MISPNKIIGSLVYRTRKALNSNAAFISALHEYTHSPNCLVDNCFSFWHYPGTPNEISTALLKIGEHVNGSLLKFPAILNFQTIHQEKKGGKTTVSYNLAIVGSVQSEWTTEQRETQVFDRLLRPIYEEFMNQMARSNYFILPYGGASHSYYEVFTTGSNSSELINRSGDYIDAIELHNLTLTVRPTLCHREQETIESENQLVTMNINNLLNN